MIVDDDDDQEPAPARKRPEAWMMLWLAAFAAPLVIVAVDRLPAARPIPNERDGSSLGIEVRIPAGDRRADMTWCELMGAGGLNLSAVNLRRTLAQYGERDPGVCQRKVGVWPNERPLVIIPDQDGEDFCDCRGVS